MFLPRNEYIVEPPRYSTSHGPVEQLKVKGEADEDDRKPEVKSKKRGSFSNLFRRKSKSREPEDPTK